MRDEDRVEEAEAREGPEEKTPQERESGGGEERGEGGRKPPPEDLQDDPAYEPDEPLKGIKGG